MEAKDVKKVAIIGAGVMGHSIAQVFATAGIETNLMDIKADLLPQALKLVKANLKTLAEYGRIKQADIPAIVKRIHPTTESGGSGSRRGFCPGGCSRGTRISRKSSFSSWINPAPSKPFWPAIPRGWIFSTSSRSGIRRDSWPPTGSRLPISFPSWKLPPDRKPLRRPCSSRPS